MIYNDKLPFPYVHCGINYFAFGANEDEIPFICECKKESIVNQIKFFLNYYQYNSCLNDRNDLLLEFLELPEIVEKNIKEKAIKNGINYSLNWVKYINFKKGICHQCNGVVPDTDHTIYIYATKLERMYGHYLDNNMYQKGLSNYLSDYFGIYFIEDSMPNDIKKILIPTKKELIEDMIKLYPQSKKEKIVLDTMNIIYNLPKDIKYRIMYQQMYSSDKKDLDDIIRENNLDEDTVQIMYKVIWKRFLTARKCIFEEVKEAFKLKRWINESILYNYVKELFHNIIIYRNYRSPILEGLELDIYIPQYNIGIEYQGVQHEKEINCWGGKEGLLLRKEHDKRKAMLCEQNDIKLIYFWYYEDITIDLVMKRLEKYIV